MASQDITADVAVVGERLSCTYCRTPQVRLEAGSPAKFPMSVAWTRLPRLAEVVPLARACCQQVYAPVLPDVETGHTGGPRWGGRTWIAGRGTAGAEVGGEGS